MNFSKTLIAGLLGVGLLAALPVQATILSNYLTFDGPEDTDDLIPNQGGGEDELQDDSLSVFLNLDGSNIGGIPTFTDGDIIYGLITLSEIDSSGVLSESIGADDQIAIIFSTVINGDAAGDTLNLDPIADITNDYDLRNLLDASVQTSINDDTIAVAVSSSNAAEGDDDPQNWTPDQITTDFDNDNGWFWEMTLGLVEDTDFFAFQGNFPSGSERGAFTIQDQAFVADWLPVDVFDFANDKHLADATLDIGSVNPAGEDNPPGWDLRDQSTFFVNPVRVPEPSIIALLGIAFAGLGLSKRRKVRNA